MKTDAITGLLNTSGGLFNGVGCSLDVEQKESITELAVMEADNAAMKDEILCLKTDMPMADRLMNQRVSIEKLQSDNAAMRDQTIAECKAAVATALVNGELPLEALCALTPDSGKVLVDVDELKAIECAGPWGGCPVCGAVPEDAVLERWHKTYCWLAALLKGRP